MSFVFENAQYQSITESNKVLLHYFTFYLLNPNGVAMLDDKKGHFKFVQVVHTLKIAIVIV